MAVPAITGKGAAEHPAAPFLPAKKSLAKRRGRAGLWFVMPWIVGFLLWYAIPMLASLWFSFTDFNLVSNEPTEFIGLDNWSKLFSDPDVRASVLVTARFGLIALPVAVLFPMGLAYLLVKKNLKGRETFRALFFMPSIIPISTSFCMDSRLVKCVTLVILDPVGVGSKVKTMRIDGMSSFGRPSSSAKPSSTSNRRGGSTARKRHQPRDVLPSGPVMWYSERPPTVMSCRVKVAGQVSGPQNRSS